MGSNTASAENGKNSRFSQDNQPKNKGRKKSIFGALEKENDLSLDDLRKIYKNILTAKSIQELEKVKDKFPTVLTDMTIEMLKQDKIGRLNGNKMTIIQTVNENGEVIKTKAVGDRVKSYETVQYMLDRLFGKASEKVDLTHAGNISIGKPPTPEEAYPD